MQSLVAISGKIQSRLLRYVFAEQWVIGVRRQSGHRPSAGIASCFLLEPSMGMHYADPFVLCNNGTTFVFFEAWSEDDSKGTIWVATVDPHHLWSQPERVLERSYHLSYPFVFEWLGDLYMLPETHHNHTIELYRAVNFPWQWDLAEVLMDGVDAVDSTLFEYNGRWWMFSAGFGDSGARLRHLSVFHAKSPFGPWQPHPCNPVVNNLSAARPAGRVFVDNGQLIRPSQDCRLRYGHAIAWNRVDLLNEREYHETRVATLWPRLIDGWLATHTFNQDGEWQVLDGKRIIRPSAENRATAA